MALQPMMLNSLLISLIVFANQRVGVSALSPPTFTDEPPITVWFQPTDNLSGRQSKFELPCVAAGDPETFKWKKDDEPFIVDGTHVTWSRPGQAGSIQFKNPDHSDQGFYQCFVSNAFGTAVSNRVHVRLGFLEHFPDRGLKVITAVEGKSVSVKCKPPRGIPPPNVDWFIRDLQTESVMESVAGTSERISVDEEGTIHFSYVLRNDTQTTRFFECAVSSPVLRGEYRGGDRIQINVVPKTPIQRLDPYILSRSEEYITVRAGDNLKLSCILGGYPLVKPTWSKVDEQLPLDRIQQDPAEGNRFLQIHDIHPADSGTYVCEYFGERAYFEVTVKAAPYWEAGKPMDVTEMEDDSAELHCLASGNPRPLIRWFMNGVPIHELRDNNTRRMILDDGRVLRISDIKHDVDTGVYQCNASNPSGFVFANAYINVLAMAPQFKSPEKKIYHVARHETVELPCVVEAAPKPTIHWVDANDQPILLVDGKVELFSDNSLKIYHVDHTDERVYYCNVSNKYGINRAESTLFVYDPLYFRQVPSPQRLEVDAHGSLELRCEAVADSRLTLRYLWTLNGRPFDFLPDMEEQASVLRLIDIRGRSTGRIECTAITEIGQKKSHMDLIVKDVPEPPSEVRLTCQPRSALISWKSASEHGSPVNEYRIEMKNNFQLDDKWQQVLLEEAGDKKEYEAQVTLSPWVNYTFRIIALNSYGESRPTEFTDSGDDFHCETQPNVPFTNPQNVRVAGTKPDNLVIRWDPLPKMEWNAPGLRYQIKYRLKEPHAKWTEFLIEDPLADHTILRERPTFKEYEVRIRAVNERGQSSQPPEIYTGFSGEDVPLEAPTDLSLVSIDDYDQITVRWNAVNPETVRGHFKGYKVTYWINDNPYYSESVVVGAQNLSAQLKGLKALTNYTVEVRAVNGQYESPSSFTIQLSTPEGRPSEVTNLKVFAVGAQSMLATWNPPAEPNGNIRGYFVQFENSSSPSQIGESYVLYNQLHYLSEQLEPDSAYIFRVWAETNGGEGAKRSALFRTFQLRDPDPPLFSVLPFKSHSFLVKWQAPDPTNYSFPGTTFHLKYTLAGSDQWNTTEEIALPKRELILDGLQSQQEYWIIGVARENDRRAQSLRFKVLTGGGLGLSHFNPENLREAAWFIAILVVLALILIILAICCCCAQCRVSGRYSVQKREKQFGLIGVGADESGEYQKFLEYHHLGASSNDPPTISVSLADSTLEGRAKRVPMQVLQEEDIVVLADDKNDSPPLSRHGETDKLLPKK